MNGAIADPLVNTINTPKINNTMINGNSQNFLRTFKNPHKSFKKSICDLFNKVFQYQKKKTDGFLF